MSAVTFTHGGRVAAVMGFALLIAAPALAQENQDPQPQPLSPLPELERLEDALENTHRPRPDARLFDPSIGFDVPSRAEDTARARQVVRAARRVMRRSQHEAIRVEREHLERLHASPEFREAVREHREAREQLEQARQQRDTALREHPLYQSTVERKEEMERMIAEAHARTDVHRVQLQEMAQQRLWYAQRLNELQEELGEQGENDPVEQARQRLVEVADRVAQMKAHAREQARDAPEVAEARDRRRQARAFFYYARAEHAGARAGYLEADFQQPIQDRIRRLRPVRGTWPWW